MNWSASGQFFSALPPEMCRDPPEAQMFFCRQSSHNSAEQRSKYILSCQQDGARVSISIGKTC